MSCGTVVMCCAGVLVVECTVVTKAVLAYRDVVNVLILSIINFFSCVLFYVNVTCYVRCFY